MRTRSIATLAAFAGIAATTALLAPTAVADDIVPGVACAGTNCTNDNDEDYVVSGTALCIHWNFPTYQNGNDTSTTSIEPEAFRVTVPAHGQATLTPGCTGGDVMSSWNITGAAPSSQVPTGSWG
ncbi:hypothetical protein ACQP1O_24895 [Nocardia sp. CA-151230]|uniref:hypothetical protein n=1 Tax=Nocardia sp. CA-151230 TaxID=3239982 RepID=UPI003D8D1509